jgi:hypothetical protein
VDDSDCWDRAVRFFRARRGASVCSDRNHFRVTDKSARRACGNSNRDTDGDFSHDGDKTGSHIDHGDVDETGSHVDHGTHRDDGKTNRHIDCRGNRDECASSIDSYSNCAGNSH